MHFGKRAGAFSVATKCEIAAVGSNFPKISKVLLYKYIDDAPALVGVALDSSVDSRSDDDKAFNLEL
jgi:hypothetical protein